MATLNDNQWELIAKYMVPDCSTEDKAEAEKQAQENPEFGSALDDSLSYWNTAPKVKPKIQAPDLDKQLDKMYAKLASAVEEEAKPLFQPTEQKRSGFGALRWAAAVVVMLGATYLAMSYYGDKGQQFSTVASVEQGAASKTFAFPDGSDITLKSGEIKWLSDESSDTREVALNGEAFFDVARDESKPFIIKTGHAQTQVLGTSFNIKEQDNVTSIEVKTGKVSFKGLDNGEELILKPGSSASFDEAKGALTLHQSGEYAAFKYSDVSLKMVMTRMTAQYGKEFSFASAELENIKVNLGEMEMHDDKWTENLTVISKVAKVKIEEQEGVYSVMSLD